MNAGGSSSEIAALGIDAAPRDSIARGVAAEGDADRWSERNADPSIVDRRPGGSSIVQIGLPRLQLRGPGERLPRGGLILRDDGSRMRRLHSSGDEIGDHVRVGVCRRSLDRRGVRLRGDAGVIRRDLRSGSALWIPADSLPEFNAHIVGPIDVIHEFRAG